MGNDKPIGMGEGSVAAPSEDCRGNAKPDRNEKPLLHAEKGLLVPKVDVLRRLRVLDFLLADGHQEGTGAVVDHVLVDDALADAFE